MACIIDNQEEIRNAITEIANSVTNGDYQEAKNLISAYQTDYEDKMRKKNKSVSSLPFPSVRALKLYKAKLRKENIPSEGIGENELVKALESESKQNEESKSIVQELQRVNLDFDPVTRRNRVVLISRLFSNEITSLLNESQESLKVRIAQGNLNSAIEASNKKNTRIYDQIKAAKTEDEELQLRLELDSLDRWDVINKYTPAGIFYRVRKVFSDYVNDTENNRVEAELRKINSMRGSEKYSDDLKREKASKTADYKYKEYIKILNNFHALAQEASYTLIDSEGISIDSESLIAQDPINDSDNSEDYSNKESEEDNWEIKTAYKEGWMTNFRQASSFGSLSKDVKKAISEIPKLSFIAKKRTNPTTGEIEYYYPRETDDLGFYTYLDSNYVHASLMDKLRNMTTSDDMLPLLKSMSKQKPWVSQIISLLEKNDTLYSQFFQDFNKDFTPYWIQKRKLMPDGQYKMTTISVNTPEGVYYIINSIRDNQESGTQLDSDSIYDKNGNIDKTNASRGLEWTKTLIDKFSVLSGEDQVKLLDNDQIWYTINKLMHMIGVDANQDLLREALEDIKPNQSLEVTTPVLSLLSRFNVIFKGIIDTNTEENKKIDLINTFGSPYNFISKMIADVTEDAIESSISQVIGGKTKTFYSHTTPNYLGKEIKNLKNVSGSAERFEDYMSREFKAYDWFYKDNHWMNDWLKQLYESPEMRKELDHKVVLASDRLSYSNWGNLDYTLALLTEYWSVPDNNKSNNKWAWYYVPILSDSPSAEFIKFRKYTNGDELDENGNKMSYDEIITNKFIDLINQEYNRIVLVEKRDEAYQSGSNIEPIANFDIVRNKDGKIKNIGGAEFKFIPALNNYVSYNSFLSEEDANKAYNQRVEYLSKVVGKEAADEFKVTYNAGENFPEPFREKLERLKMFNSGRELKGFLQSTISDIMEDGFEKDYQDFAKIGLLDELPNGKYKYLPFKGQSEINNILIKALENAKELLGDNWGTMEDTLLRRLKEGAIIRDSELKTTIDNISGSLINIYSEDKALMVAISSIIRNLNTTNIAKEALREYYWNSKFATSQIIELTTTDLAFYKDMDDFQKRYKEVHAPSLKMNLKATYNGESIGRKFEKTIYLADDEIISPRYDTIKAVLDDKLSKGEITKLDRDFILTKFKNVNVADAQAFRSLSSYRSILGMSGKWDEKMQKAYDNFKEGNWNITDFNMIWQTLKPYVYTQIGNESGIERTSKIKTPVQHKNSEFLLLAMYNLISNSLGKSEKLKAINRFMENSDHPIDVVQFESTTKVGKQGVIDINHKQSIIEDGKELNYDKEKENLLSKVDNGEITSEEMQNELNKFNYSGEEVYQILMDATGYSNNNENPNVVHTIPYEDYGIQTATPEHAIDAVALVGTQIRKLLPADIDSDTIIGTEDMMTQFKSMNPSINIPLLGITAGDIVSKGGLTKDQWMTYYNAINTSNIIDKFSEVNNIFKSPKEIEKILLQEIRGNQRYGTELERACTLDKDNNFNIPLFDPIQSQKVQNLLNSIIKSRVTKQKIRGGALIQVSDYGLSDSLNIVFKNKNNEIISLDNYLKKNKGASKESYYNYVKQELKNGNLSIDRLECYMPAYSREFYEPLMNSKTHQLDVNKLPDELRRLIGYRIPTEDKYSMAPLYIKGFLPQQNGSAIMLPSEITVLSGSDFDVDKMFVMLPEFSIRREYNMGKAWNDFYNDESNKDIVNEISANFNTQLEKYIKEQTEDWEESPSTEDLLDLKDEFRSWLKEENIKNYNFSERAQERFSKWFRENKENYFTRSNIEKIKYNFSKSPIDNSLKARNNLLIDLMYSVLSNSDTTFKILNPGGFDYQKRASRIVSILENSTMEQLSNILKEYGLKFNGKGTYSNLFNMDLDKLDEVVKKTKSIIDPLSPRTQVFYHQQNMTGAKLISIYANHNASHALMQHTLLGLNPKYGAFKLNGKSLTSLHSIKNTSNELISKNNAGYLAASVDNVKDPILAVLNQNLFTADATMLLSRLGYNPIEVGLLMSQPIIKEIANNYILESRNGRSKEDVITSTIAKYSRRATMSSGLSYENYNEEEFKLEDLADNILRAKTASNIQNRSETDDFGNIEYFRNQTAIGYLFRRIMSTADALGMVVRATRADTANGAAGPTIADNLIKMQKVKDLMDESENPRFPLSNSEVINDNDDYVPRANYLVKSEDGTYVYSNKSIPDAIDLGVEHFSKQNNGKYEINKDLGIDAFNLSSNKSKKAFSLMKLMNVNLPYLQAFYSLGIKGSVDMLNNYFPQLTTPFVNVIKSIRSITKYNRLDVSSMNSIYNDLLAYIMSKDKFFGQETKLVKNNEGYENKVITSEEKRKRFINDFPSEFKKIVSENEDIAKLEFIKRLRVTRANDNNPVDSLIFKNVGQLSPVLKEKYMSDWSSLLYMNNPIANNLAFDLFRYSYYRNGFAFGPSTFIHLAPIMVRLSIPEYISTLNDLLLSEDNYDEFTDQYVLNHLDNRKLVTEIPNSSNIEFLGEDKKFKDEVTVIIDNNSNFDDKKTLHSTISDGDIKLYEFQRYISTRDMREHAYYILYKHDPGSNIATYKRVYPLGVTNNFIEYEYGRNAFEMKSQVIPSEKVKNINYNYKNSNSYMESNYEGQMNGADSYDVNSEEDIPDYVPQEGYDDSIEGVEKFCDMNTVDPNTEYRDADDKIICGAERLKNK